jgi:chromosome transmission fidelity protein 18
MEITNQDELEILLKKKAKLNMKEKIVLKDKCNFNIFIFIVVSSENVQGEDENQKNQLWVDKYSPSKYYDLLTDERVNREILLWVKSWDEIVFGNKKKQYMLPKTIFRSGNVFGGKNEFSNNNKKNSFQNNKNSNNDKTKNETNETNNFKSKVINNNQNSLNDKFNNNFEKEAECVQSKYKIILIAGPPGTGKTTLAKVIATQCGYDTITVLIK